MTGQKYAIPALALAVVGALTAVSATQAFAEEENFCTGSQTSAIEPFGGKRGQLTCVQREAQPAPAPPPPPSPTPPPTPSPTPPPPPKDVVVEIRVKNKGAFIPDACAFVDEKKIDCASPIVGMTESFSFSAPPDTPYKIKGETGLGPSKTHNLKVGSSDEVHCFQFSGTTIIGFGFKKVNCG